MDVRFWKIGLKSVIAFYGFQTFLLGMKQVHRYHKTHAILTHVKLLFLRVCLVSTTVQYVKIQLKRSGI